MNCNFHFIESAFEDLCFYSLISKASDSVFVVATFNMSCMAYIHILHCSSNI